MLLGQRQELVVVKCVDFGVYLANDSHELDDKVLLPKKQVPPNVEIGQKIDVFVYRDSKDRLIATTNHAKVSIGEVAVLKVAQVGKFGAFLDWGLEKELLLPFKEQTKPVKEGEDVLVSLYIDKSDRLCATMKVYPFLDKNSPYEKDQMVKGRVYEISQEFGAFVAVEDRYCGLIAQKELYGSVEVNQIIEARIAYVKPDGKLDLSIRQKAHLQMEEDAKRIRKAIEVCGGMLPFNDKASPELIRSRMNMSKAEFKRAVGTMLKAGEIQILEDGIKLNK